MRITAAGDCGVDRYLNLGWDRPGGISLNFAVCARRFFAPSDRVGVISALGTDPEAELVRQATLAHGLEACLPTLPGATSLQCIDREASGEKVFVRYEAGVLADLRMGAREREIIADSDLLMAVVYAQVEDLFESVMDCPSRGLRAVDFGDLAGVTGDVALVEKYSERFHVGFFGLAAADGDRIDWLERLARRTGRLLVVTLGPHGSLALGGGQRIACPAVPVPRVVDTTGAGDTFAAGFLAEYGLTRRVAESLRLGATKAAESIQQLGAFPWPAEPLARGGELAGVAGDAPERNAPGPWDNAGVGSIADGTPAPNEDLPPDQRAWALHSEELRRRADAIVSGRPDLDAGDVYHALRALELPPAERLRRGLTRVRVRPHAR